MRDKLNQFMEENGDSVRKTIAFSLFAMMAALWLLMPEKVMAGGGGGGAEFDEIWITLEEWTQGTLGRIIALAIIVVGIVMGIARQSLLAFAVGIAGGMGLYNAPTVVEGVMGATVVAGA